MGIQAINTVLIISIIISWIIFGLTVYFMINSIKEKSRKEVSAKESEDMKYLKWRSELMRISAKSTAIGLYILRHDTSSNGAKIVMDSFFSDLSIVLSSARKDLEEPSANMAYIREEVKKIIFSTMVLFHKNIPLEAREMLDIHYLEWPNEILFHQDLALASKEKAEMFNRIEMAVDKR